jgi:hypothetical protein
LHNAKKGERIRTAMTKPIRSFENAQEWVLIEEKTMDYFKK